MTPSLRRVIQRFAPYLRAQRRTAGLALAALALEIGLKALEPWPLKYVFDRILTDGGTASGGALLGAAALVVLITGARATASYWNTLGFSLVGNRMVTAVREDLYRHLTRLSLAFHARQRGGDLVVRLSRDTDLVKEVLVTGILPLAGNVAILVVMSGLMLWLNWRLALVALALLPAFWHASRRLGPKIQGSARAQRRREGAAASAASEAIGAIKVVQALSLEGTVTRAFARENRGSQGEDVQARRLSAQLERTVDVLTAVATALVLAVGARLVLAARLTPGELLVFLSYLKSAYKPMQDVAKYTGRIAKAMAAGERIADLLEEQPEVQDAPGARAAPALRGAVTLDRVTFGYTPGRPVLRELSLTLAPGSVVALVGPSGTGKSTVAGLLLRFFDPTAGRVLLDGHDLRDLTLDSVRSQISVVLQDTLLFAASIRENIALGVPHATEADIRAAATLANAHEFISRLPDGYDTVVGERGVTLSGGQRQRIAIARAAIRRAPIVILDEPTTGLDAENAWLVTEALARVTAGATTIIISHDPALTARAQRHLRLVEGRLLAEEAPDAVAG